MSQISSPTQTAKRPRSPSLQTRLLVGSILLVLIPALITSSVATYISAQGLRNEVFAQLESVVSIKENQIRTWLATLQTNLNLIFSNQDSLKKVAEMIKGEEGTELDRARLKFDLKKYNDISSYFTEIFIMNPEGVVVLSTDDAQEGKILSSQAFFSEGLKGPYVNPPAYELSFSNYSIVISQPLKGNNGQVIGVLAGRVNLSTLDEIMNERAGLGEGGESYLVNSNFAVLTNLRFQETTLGETYIHTEGANQAVGTRGNGSGIYANYRNTSVMGVYHWIPELNIAVVSEYDEAEALQPANVVLRVSLIVSLFTILIASLAAFILTRQISTPIIRLAVVAEDISRGNLSQDVSVGAERNDEIGTLSNAFSLMTSRLRELIGTLEQRVADRTKALATVAEISTAASTYNTEQEMLSTVVSLTQRLFGLYHAHVFVYDEENEELRIVACGWKEGDEHQGTHGTTAIPLNAEQSLVARAARTRQPVIVNDVHNEPGWLPNVLLPDSASELAVPLLIGEKVLGVLDVQSDRLNAFTPSDANVQTTLANQVAVALQNIQQYRKTEVLAAELAGFESAVSEAAIVATTDVTGKIETVNENLIRISQYSREELIGQDHRILNSGYHPKEFIRNLWATIANGKVWRGEIRNKAKDGSYYWVDTTISPVFNDLGKPIKYVSVRFDITPRKELELAVTKRATQVEALDAITQKIQSATKIETALQIAARELSHALGMKPTIVSIDLNTSPTKDDKEPQT